MTVLSSQTITYGQLAKVIDHSLLRPELTEALIHLTQRNGFILLSKNTRPFAENRSYLPPPNAEAAESKMQNRMREEVILKFQG